MPDFEPRMTIRNGRNVLFVDGNWACTTIREGAKGNKEKQLSSDAKFKVQWCKRSDKGVATTVVIRTDCIPGSLLDVRDLKFQGATMKIVGGRFIILNLNKALHTMIIHSV